MKTQIIVYMHIKISTFLNWKLEHINQHNLIAFMYYKNEYFRIYIYIYIYWKLQNIFIYYNKSSRIILVSSICLQFINYSSAISKIKPAYTQPRTICWAEPYCLVEPIHTLPSQQPVQRCNGGSLLSSSCLFISYLSRDPQITHYCKMHHLCF